MEKRLDVLLTQSRKGGPLVQIINIPGNDAYLTTEQIRSLAEALWCAADECDARAKAVRVLPPTTRSYELTETNSTRTTP
jgi:hypothetical protein